VRANPKPQNSIIFSQAKCAVMVPDSHDADVVAPFFKSKGWMEWIAFPYRVFVSCEIFESGPAISRNPSRNAGASCRSRQVLHAASVKIGPNFIQNRAEPSVFIEIFIDLPVPRRTISLAQKGDQFRELFRRKLIYCSFDFGQTHILHLTRPP
jgi:hypothetical protein